MATITPAQQFFGTALAILIVALLLYGLILLIQWLAKGKGNTRVIERDTVVEETVFQPVQTQTFSPGMRFSTPSMGVGGVSMGAGGGAGAGAGMNVGGGGKAGAL